MKVRFSIVMPVYNQEKYVGQAIDSVLSQNFLSYELLVVDDGSTHGSAEVLRSYGTRLRLIQQRNQGPEVARNMALALAQGEYLAMLDHDDLLRSCAHATYDQIIRTFDSPPLIIGSMTSFHNGQTIPAKAEASPGIEVLRYPDFLSKDVQTGLSNSRSVIRRSLFEAVGGYGNRGVTTFPPDDYNLILKVGTSGPCTVVQKPCTVAHREHETNTTWNLALAAGGFLRLARFESQVWYPGGSKRRWGRYAIIGGIASSYAVRHCRRGGQRRLALRLLLGTAPMVLAAVWNRFLRLLRKPTQPITLPEG